MAFKDQYLESRQVKVFPTAFRGSPDFQFDPEAQLNTEYNFINLPGLNAEKNSYIIDYRRKSEDSNNFLFCVIGGYYFEIEDLNDSFFKKPLTDDDDTASPFITKDGEIKKLCIRTKRVDIKVDAESDTGAGDSDQQRYTWILDSFENTATNLDMAEPEAAEGTPYYFTGIKLNTSAEGTYLNVLVFNERTNKYVLDESSKRAVIRHGKGKDAIMTNEAALDNNASDFENSADGDYSFAHGKHTTAIGNYSHAEGINTIAKGNGSHAEGENTEANKINAHAEGKNTIVNAESAHAEGISTKVGKDAVGAHAEGLGNGINVNAGGEYSHSEGKNTRANGDFSHTEGNNTKAENDGAHAEGKDTEAIGEYSHAEGVDTHAHNAGAHTEGNHTEVEADFAHAEGIYTKATGEGSHAEGIGDSTKQTIASGEGSHAEGWQTTASGDYSHAEGSGTIASRIGAHAEGYNTTAEGNYSHTEGCGTYTTKTGQTVVGKFNANVDGEFVVGVGTSTEARDNGLVVNGKTTTVQNTLKVVNGESESFKVDTNDIVSNKKTTINAALDVTGATTLKNTLNIKINETDKVNIAEDATTLTNTAVNVNATNFKVNTDKLTVSNSDTNIENTNFSIVAGKTNKEDATDERNIKVRLKSTANNELAIKATGGIVLANSLFVNDTTYLKSDLVFNSGNNETQSIKYTPKDEDAIEAITFENSAADACNVTINSDKFITNAKSDISLKAGGSVVLKAADKTATFDTDGTFTCSKIDSTLGSKLGFSKTTNASISIIDAKFIERSGVSNSSTVGTVKLNLDHEKTTFKNRVFLDTISASGDADKLIPVTIRQFIDTNTTTAKHTITLLDGNGKTNIETLNVNNKITLANTRLSIDAGSNDKIFIKAMDKDTSAYVYTVADSGLIYTAGGLRSDVGIEALFFNAKSDKRLKENFKEYIPAKSILDLPIYKYDFINGPKDQIGCLAQDLQEICPELVQENSDGYLTIQENKLVYLLLEEVKKLKKQLEEK